MFSRPFRKGTILFILLFHNLLIVKAQLKSTAFYDFNQVSTHFNIVNPSAQDTTYQFKVLFNQVEEFGLLNNVKRFNFLGEVTFSKNSNFPNHYVGFQSYNFKIGDFISKNHTHLKYSYLLQINKQSYLSGGISFGLVNYNFLTSTNSYGGSDFAPDGSIGMVFFRKSFLMGFAIQQIFSPSLTPVDQKFTLNRLANLSFQKKIKVTNYLMLKLDLHSQFQQNAKLLYNCGLMAIINNYGLIGIGNFSLNKSSITSGVQNISIKDLKFNLIVSYNFYHQTIPLPNNSIEFNISVSK